MLNVENLTLHYGHSQVLYDVSMSAQAGAVTCLMGTNGVGKTSLLKAISGAHARSGGSVSLDGTELSRTTPAHQIARAGVGYVPQGRDIFPLMTVRENLETGFACLPKSEHFVPDEIYELFPILAERRHTPGTALSGGQQQMLAVGRALMANPDLMVLDEPSEGLAPRIVDEMEKILRELAETGVAILLIEQHLRLVLDLAERFYVLSKGRVSETGLVKDVDRETLQARIMH